MREFAFGLLGASVGVLVYVALLSWAFRSFLAHPWDR